MENRELIKRLFEMTLDMDYMNCADCFEEEMEILCDDLESIKDTTLYILLKNLAERQESTELTDRLERGI